MSTLRDLVEEHTALGPESVEHLHRLAGEWQLLADLSFADLLLWVPIPPGDAFLCVAQVRPTTAPTAYLDDQVGRLTVGPEAAHLRIAVEQGRIWREGDPVWYGDTPARHEAIPVGRPVARRARRRGRTTATPTAVPTAGGPVAVVGRDTNLSIARSPSQLELSYLNTADDLAQMVADGTFPPPRQTGETTSAPRVGDGLIRLDAAGTVVYASPNAQSAYRRLGYLGAVAGTDLAELTRSLSDDPLEGGDAAERIRAALAGRAPGRREIEAAGAAVLMRALPLQPAGVPIGALVLVRDVTELRRRDRALVTKDATIREIHHRVKNNLQTVAALLRLQARRMSSRQARLALEESVRRVASIALVHETLALTADEAVEFDGIVDRLASMAAEVAAPESRVTLRRDGSFGVLPAEVATPLVIVLGELLQNAVEHAYRPGESGEVTVAAQRHRRELRLQVTDAGRGLPRGFELNSDPKAGQRLGLQIVRTLVTGELRGSIELRAREGGGTEAVLTVPLSRR